MRRLAMTLVALGLVFVARVAGADATDDQIFERGNQAYLHGDFQTAVDAYEQLMAGGVVHEDLHYNLANAYVKTDRLGPAILHYEQALALDPSEEDARTNLRLAREAAQARWQDKVQGADSEPTWMKLLSLVPPGTLALLFLGVYVAMFALALAVYLISPGFLRVSLIALLVFAFAGTLGTGGLLGGRWWLANRVEQGIVLPDEMAVKEGPDATAEGLSWTRWRDRYLELLAEV